MSGLTAVDVVLREQEHVAALPGVVHLIRRYADASVFVKLRRALRTSATVATLEQIVREHSEDIRLDGLERCSSEDEQTHVSPALAYIEQISLIDDVLRVGAQQGSTVLVDWAIRVAPIVRASGWLVFSVINGHASHLFVDSALRDAVSNGHTGVAQLLYSKVNEFCYGFDESELLDLAAARGHVGVLDWLFANRRDPHASCTPVACTKAAETGHIHVLQWIRLHCPQQWSSSMFLTAALHDQEGVMDWLYSEQIYTRIDAFMEELVTLDKCDALMYLHRKYPLERLSLSTLKRLATTCLRDAVVDLVTAFPARYARDGVVVGVLYGDPARVQTLALARRHTNNELKYAMCAAARLGSLEALRWLHSFASDSKRSTLRNCTNSNAIVPTKALWQALRCAHVAVVAWILEQRPDMRTRAQLEAMITTSKKQPTLPLKQNQSSNQRSNALIDWLDQQLVRLHGEAVADSINSYTNNNVMDGY